MELKLEHGYILKSDGNQFILGKLVMRDKVNPKTSMKEKVESWTDCGYFREPYYALKEYYLNVKLHKSKVKTQLELCNKMISIRNEIDALLKKGFEL